MKEKTLKVGLIVIAIITLIFIGIKLYQYIRIKTAKIEVVLNQDLTLEFTQVKQVSDFIDSINGQIIDNYYIDSTNYSLGKTDIKFTFINEDDIKLNYTFQIEIIDKEAPLIFLSNTYSVKVGSKINLTDKIMCADNIDDEPNCFIEGDYDLNKEGNYSLTYKAIDASGNTRERKFTLNVYKPSSNSSNSQTPKTYTYLEDVIKTHKNENTKIGLDVSKWQEDIDFQKVKEQGVEFVLIRIGSSKGENKANVIDEKFKQNIENALNANLEVGLYFYSYANTIEKAEEEAKWIINQIKDYKITLPIAYDWEEWANFNSYNVSINKLNKMAETFINTLEDAGYKGMLYSSKHYLENIWYQNNYKVWLAHYTKQTNYQGDYFLWQLCNNGKVEGINTDVDINVLYKKQN